MYVRFWQFWLLFYLDPKALGAVKTVECKKRGGKPRGDGVFARGNEPTHRQLGGWGVLLSPPAGVGTEPQPPKSFRLLWALGMASPDTTRLSVLTCWLSALCGKTGHIGRSSPKTLMLSFSVDSSRRQMNQPIVLRWTCSKQSLRTQSQVAAAAAARTVVMRINMRGTLSVSLPRVWSLSLITQGWIQHQTRQQLL